MLSENHELKGKIETLLRETLKLRHLALGACSIGNIELAAEKITDCVEGLD